METAQPNSTAPSVLCIGELVWDVFTDSVGKPITEHLGGAPMNAAYHLCKLGCAVTLVSSIGVDRRGDAALLALQALDLPTQHVQRDAEHATGVSLITTDARGEPRFNLLEDAAWDFVQPSAGIQAAASQVDAIIFGSLGQRAPVSCATTRALLGTQRWRIFDVNLRPPFDEWAVIDWSLQHANVVKANADEIDVIASRLDLPTEPHDFAAALAARYSLSMVLVTLGSRGAGAWCDGEWSFVTAPAITVVDTVGAGDAFLGGFLAAWLRGSSAEAALTQGCKLGALVASHAGATPDYSVAEIGIATASP